MNRFFILGNHPELSAAELTARFDFKKPRLLNEVLLGETEIGDPMEAMRTLGGTIKLGKIIARVTTSQLYETLLAEIMSAPKTSKFNFGISVYGKSKVNTHKLGLELKSALKAESVSCRFVTSRDTALSSVVVEQNKLVNGGRELVLITEDNLIAVGVTEAVQPFKDLSFRDFGRPGRDDFSGMLPPKLAQIMINLSRGKKDELLIDPFCGSGTILTEAMIMNYTKIEGSDISEKAVLDSKKNIDWVAKKFNAKTNVIVTVADARNLSKKYKANAVGAIVAETYLGPQRGHIDTAKVTRELSELYSDTLREISVILKQGGRAVLALPIFLPSKTRLSPVIPKNIEKKDSFIYSRAGQSVGREIIVFQK